MNALVDRISPNYVRPKCASCGRTLAFVHFNPSGSRYACLPCELGPEYEDMTGTDDYRMTASEASWIIRNTEGNER